MTICRILSRVSTSGLYRSRWPGTGQNNIGISRISPFSAQVARSDLYEEIDAGTTGVALIASTSLPRGQVLFDRIGGTILPRPNRHSIQVGEDKHLLCGGDVVLCNHSCEPNCILKATLVEGGGATGSKDKEETHAHVSVVVAAETISPGEYLTIDYNSFEWNMSSPFDCICGSKHCNGKIAGFSKLPLAVQQRYLHNEDGSGQADFVCATQYVQSRWADEAGKAQE